MKMHDLLGPAVQAAHQHRCADCTQMGSCPAGPNEDDLGVATAVLLAALKAIDHGVRRELFEAAQEIELAMDPDLGEAAQALADPVALLRQWFHWWRDNDDLPAKLPGALHVATAAALTVDAVAAGRSVHGPADL